MNSTMNRSTLSFVTHLPLSSAHSVFILDNSFFCQRRRSKHANARESRTLSLNVNCAASSHSGQVFPCDIHGGTISLASSLQSELFSFSSPAPCVLEYPHLLSLAARQYIWPAWAAHVGLTAKPTETGYTHKRTGRAASRRVGKRHTPGRRVYPSSLLQAIFPS